MLVSVVVYSALVSGIVFTNHTIPNSLLYPYPSFKTVSEGRWLADILIQLFGGGSQTFQAFAGLLIQSVNGLLFAELIGARGVAKRTMIALFVALFPAVPDLYSFTADNITFTIAQALSLSAVFALDRIRLYRWSIPTAAVLFALSLAGYQPLIVVSATVLVAWLLHRSITTTPRVSLFLASGLAMVLGLLLYWISTKLTIIWPLPVSTNTNGVREVAWEILRSYPNAVRRFYDFMIHQPLAGRLGVAATVVLSGWAVAAKLTRSNAAAIIACLILMPLALQAVFIINADSTPSVSRFGVGYGYYLAFAASLAFDLFSKLKLGVVATSAALYGLLFLAVQENGYTALKSDYETQAINRLVLKVGDLLKGDEHPALVVIGQFPLDHLDRLLSYPKRPFRPHTSSAAFMPYRQVEIANFFMGADNLRSPTTAERDAALADAASHPIWPANGSVYRSGDVIVAVLSRKTEDVTWVHDP